MYALREGDYVISYFMAVVPSISVDMPRGGSGGVADFPIGNEFSRRRVEFGGLFMFGVLPGGVDRVFCA